MFSFQPLLNGDNVPYQAYLGVGALAGKFCREHDCENVQEFKDLLNFLSAPLSRGCKVSSVEQENNVSLIGSYKTNLPNNYCTMQCCINI